MKNIIKNILVIVLALCVLMSLAACGSSAPAKTEAPTETEAVGALDRYDYVVVMNGTNVEFTINKNLKSVSGEIKSNGLEISGYCTVEDGILTPTEYVTGNEKVWAGFAAHSYKLNPDGTADVLD